MGTSGINRLEHMQYSANLESQNGAKDDVDAMVKQHKNKVEAAYKHQLHEIQKAKEARETQSFWTLLGAIFLGPLIGSAIGGAIGGWANDGAEADAREAKKKGGLADLEVSRAFDKFEEARDQLDESAKQGEQIEKFGRELRDQKWTGTN